MRNKLFLIGVILTSVIVLLISFYYVPRFFIEFTDSQYSQFVITNTPEFILENSQIKRLYGNRDRPAMIFGYKPRGTLLLNDILDSIIEESVTKNWRVLEKRQNYALFERTGSSGKFNSVEKAKIIVVEPENLTVYVGWIRFTELKDANSISSDRNNIKREQAFWLLMESYITCFLW